MKILANTLWIIGSMIVVVGAFFKIMHYAGSAMLMMTGFFATAAGLILGLITSKKTKAS